MRSSAVLTLATLGSIASGYELPAKLKSLYDKHQSGPCSNKLSDTFQGGASYCGDIPNAIFLKGNGTYDNMDIDCDGVNRSAGACANDQTGQDQTAFMDTVKTYGIPDLDANLHPYVVFGNAEADPSFVPQDHGIKPLSVMAVICNDQHYGIWGDVNGGVLTGEASLSMAKLCFPNEPLSGNNGHDAKDVMYIAFTGNDAVPGKDGANWSANNTEDFAKSIKCLGDKLVDRLYLDRNALPNARVQGIETHLGLTGDQFNICISTLFAGYLALQIPSNLILTRVRPSIYLPVCMALWGLVSASTAAVTNFTGLVICRFFLGFLEAPFFPGALLLLSSWYTPKEMATRTAIMYTGSLLSSAFGGLVGAGIQYGMDGARGLHAWQWLFLLEGTITVVVSLGSVFVLPDFPSNTAWLTAEERALAIHRLHAHSGSVDEERGPLLQGLKMAVLDYKVWLLTLIVILKTSAGAVTQFIPTLVDTFHFGRVQTLLMTAPPFVFAAIVALGVSVSSDRLGERCLHLVVPLAFALIGFIIAATTESLAPRYFSLFLALGGVYGCYDITYAWMSSTVPRPIEKRSSAFAIANMVGNIAQVYSPYMYPKSSGPRYLPAMVANSGFVLASIACCATLYWCLRRENELLEAAQMQGHDDDDAGSDASKDGSRERAVPVAILDPGFRYML